MKEQDIMKEQENLDATIKSAFNRLINMISNKLERTKSHRSEEENARLQKDLRFLRGIAVNPGTSFRNCDKDKLQGQMLDLSILTTYNRERLLETLISLSSKYYNEGTSTQEIKELNRKIVLKSKKGFERALNVFRVFVGPEHFVVKENQK